MYKDKELQKKTTKDRVRRYRALHKGVTDTLPGVTPALTRVLKELSKLPQMGTPYSKETQLHTKPVQPTDYIERY